MKLLINNCDKIVEDKYSRVYWNLYLDKYSRLYWNLYLNIAHWIVSKPVLGTVIYQVWTLNYTTDMKSVHI